VDLACRRGNRVLFKGLNLSVTAGQALWLRGRNGSGKTSLLRLAAGLSVPADGQITWEGVPVRRHAGYAQRMLYVGHANALKDDLSTTESLRFLAVMHGRRADDAALSQALQHVGMGSRQGALVRTLSQGQRRRASLARLALENEAALWILDEPYDALDVDGVAIVDALLVAHLARGGSLLLTSHQPPGNAAPRMAELDLGAYA
jgi:heme exporter protein A